MSEHTDTFQPPGAHERIEPSFEDIRAVNAQLLLASLREQQAADELRRQLAFTTAVTTSLGEGVFVLDIAGSCTFVNPAAERILGWPSELLCGQAISVVIPAQGAAGAPATSPLHEMISSGVSQRTEDAEFVHRDGSRFPAAYSAAPIAMGGQIVGAVVTFRDLTEVRQLQRSREEYLALISHDLRTPLTALYGRAQLLMRQLTKHGLKQEAAGAAAMVESSRRLTQMVEALLDRSRTDAAIESQHRSVVNLVELVQRTIDQNIAPDDRARVSCEADAELAVIVDEAQVERVISNLLANALKFSPRERLIVVRVYRQAADAIVAVVDHGLGIASEDLPHLFTKHYRAPTVAQIAGSGLGLYSSRLIVEAHGGRLWAESAVGVGSTFTVALPLPA